MTRSDSPSRCCSRWVARSLALSVVLALAALMVGTVSTGCGSTCDTSGQAPVAYKDGLNPSPTTYESTDPQAAWLHFPPGRRYRLYHGLGTDQLMVDTDLGFEEHPLHPDGAVGNSSPAAGNAVIIEAKTPEYVQLRNDTCAEYWLWVGIRSLEGPSAKDAGTD
jgi:hypothetical protein